MGFSERIVQNLNSKKFIYVPHTYFKVESELLHLIFNSSTDLLTNILDIIQHFFKKIKLFGELDKEYFIYFNNLFESLLKINLNLKCTAILQI